MSTLNDDDLFIYQEAATGNVGSVANNNRSALDPDDLFLVQRLGTIYSVKSSDVLAAGGGGEGNALSPALPPFGGLTSTETVFDSADGKVEFSLDGTNYSTNLTVPINTFYYVDWGNDILSATHGDPYSAQITATYSDLGTSDTVDFEIESIDKVPDPFSFTAVNDVDADTQYESETISLFETINAPAQIWVTSDAPIFELRVGDGTWFNPPAIPSSTYVSHNQEVQVRHKTGTVSSGTYTTTVNIGYGTGAGEFESADFATTNKATGVNIPTLTTSNSIQPTYTTSAYSIVGNAGDHESTDWQIASNSDFSSIVVQSIGDTTNLLSWTPYVTTSPGPGQTLGSLSPNTTYYVRCRHNSSIGLSSDYQTDTITTETLTTDFSTGSDTISLPSGSFNHTNFTVPTGIGRIRVTLKGNNRGGTLSGTITVVPGEVLRVYNVSGAIGLFENLSVSGSTTQDRNRAFAVVGNAGNKASGSNNVGLLGGEGGSSQADNGTGNPPGGKGASVNAPGAAGGPNSYHSGNIREPAAGNGFAGGLGGQKSDDGKNCTGGQGGAGWYGGGGGGADDDNFPGAGTGGGGSSKWQTPTSSSWRTLSLTTNSKGTSTAGPEILIEY